MYGFPGHLPKTINFGTVAVNDVRLHSLILQNPTPNPIQVTFTAPDPPYALLSLEATRTIPGRGSIEVVFEYLPLHPGVSSSDILVTGNVLCAPRVIELTGTASDAIFPL
jgi:hypothetical protein